MDMKSLLFSFNGRINRLQYWQVTIVLLLIGGANSQTSTSYGPDNPMTLIPVIMSLISLVGFILVLWVSIAVQVKRWHDLNKSGFWVLINLIPIIGQIWVLISCGFFIGTAGSNRFGCEPK